MPFPAIWRRLSGGIFLKSFLQEVHESFDRKVVAPYIGELPAFGVEQHVVRLGIDVEAGADYV